MRCHECRSLRALQILPARPSTDSVRVGGAAPAWRHSGSMRMSAFRLRITASAAAATVVLVVGQLPAASAAFPAERPGRWLPPLSPLQVLAAFDPPAQDWLPGHRGVDLLALPGAVVTSPALGTVVFAGMVGGRPVVTIDHGALRTTYEPVTARVPVGHTVVGGQEFGVVAAGGHCDGVCVHWGALADETYVDPLFLLRGYVPVLKTPW